jgi:hypothetical protein
MTKDLWLRWVLDECDATERETVRAAIESGDPEAVGETERWRRLLELVQGDRLLTPPAALVEAAVRSLRAGETAPALPAWAGRLASQAARLVFDSFAAPGTAFAGARSAGVARRLRFEEDGLELDLLVETAGDTRRLAGQLLELGEEPAPLASARWLALVAGAVETTGRTDERGELVAELFRPGPTELGVARGDRLVVFRVPEPDLPADG